MAMHQLELDQARRRMDEEIAAGGKLRERCAAHGKERQALTGKLGRSSNLPLLWMLQGDLTYLDVPAAILENKVQALLSRVAQLLDKTSTSDSGSDHVHEQARGEVAILRRLVGASIQALKLPEDV